MTNPPIFITGNQHKADHLAQVLGIPLEHQKVDLDEIQSLSLEEIVTHKVKQAYALIGKPVLVEDVALSFTALGGLPGPFVKFFENAKDGHENMCRMLDSFGDRSATGSCMFGYYDGQRLELFRGDLHGTIAQHPRGDNGFGWDKLFELAEYSGRTRAQLTDDEYAAVYEKIRPVTALRNFLNH